VGGYSEPGDQGQADGGGPRSRPADPADHPEWADDHLHPGFFSGFGEDDGVDPPKRKRGRWAAPLISIVVILAIVVAIGGYVLHVYQKRHADYVGAGTGTVNFQVKSGDGPDALAPRLVKAGVIAAAEPFEAAAKASSHVNDLVPGLFRLRKHMNAGQAWALLINPKSIIQTTVTIPDGMRKTSVIAKLAQDTKKPLSQFQHALADTSALGLPSYANKNPEGYLFPATYNFAPGTRPLQMLQTMVKAFKQEVSSLNLPAAAKHAEFTEGQVITQASILEAEAGPSDYGKVARTLDNRLRINMPLQVDSTELFALNITGFSLTQKQLAVKSPYNTFLHQGLPPGPIDSPGAKAIYAVLHPPHGNWLYFITVDPKTGLTKFTNSKTQFDKWSAEFDKNFKNGT
jgi:UPF0755 protein